MAANKSKLIKGSEAHLVYNEQTADAYLKSLQKTYKLAKKNIQKELNSFYQEYAEAEGISLYMAKKQLTASEKNDLKDLQKLYEESIGKDPNKFSEEINKKLKKYAKSANVTRLDKLKAYCEAEIGKISNNASKGYQATGNLMYVDTMGHVGYDVGKEIGIAVEFNKPSEAVIQTALNKKFLNASFEEHMAFNFNKVVNNIELVTSQAFVQGKNPNQLGIEIADQLGMSERQAKAALRTATTLITNEASMESYRQIGIEKYQFMATLDSKTTEICRSLDGKIFNVEDKEAWVNAPPMHYNCRSTTVPYFDDLDEFHITERAAKDKSGKTKQIKNMTYGQWIKEYNPFMYDEGQKTNKNYNPDKVGESSLVDRDFVVKKEEKALEDVAPIVDDTTNLEQEAKKLSKNEIDAQKLAAKSGNVIDYEKVSTNIANVDYYDIEDQRDYLKQEYNAIKKKLSNDEIKAVENYTGSMYKYINGYLRKDENITKNMEPFILERVQKALKGLDSTFEKAKLKEEVVTLRGASPDAIIKTLNLEKIMKMKKGTLESIMTKGWRYQELFAEEIAPKIHKNKDKIIGTIVKDKGFVSTTIRKATTENFGQVIYKIKCPKGTKALYVEDISEFGFDEAELLLNKDTPMRIVGIDLNDDARFGNKLIVNIEVITEEE